jgi:two-component system sensor histidine kinase MtrB
MASDLIYDSRATLPPALGRSAELLAMQLDRFQSLLDDLLEISRFDAGAAILDAERHDVRALVEHTVDGMTPLSELKGVPVLVDLGDREATADIDQVRVERVLRNLVANAIEHADGTVVEVTVRADHRAVAVRVRDHGVGLTREQATHVFDRCWRGDPARARTTGGTGLGLSIAQEDALLHGGRLEVWGRPQHGAAFMLTLPRRAGMPLTSSPMTITGSNVEKAAAFLAGVGSAPAGRAPGPATIPDLADPEEQP